MPTPLNDIRTYKDATGVVSPVVKRQGPNGLQRLIPRRVDLVLVYAIKVLVQCRGRAGQVAYKDVHGRGLRVPERPVVIR